MSETLKFGNGKWAVKKGSTLAYNDENGNFKPLPFTFDRAGSATRVNKQGLIEVVSNNEPRIDFLNDSKGALKLEPSRSNLITYSEDFTEGVWGKTNTTIISNDVISPDGTLNASRLTDNTTDGLHVLGDGTSFVSGNTYTASVFAKKGTASRIFIGAGNPATWGADCYFDLENGTVALENIGTASIEDYGNGWYRCIVTGTSNADASTNALFGLADDTNDKTYIGSGDYAYFWGAQLEEGSYATSCIPTQGSIGTRVAESCEGAGGVNTFNDSEGVLYWEGSTSKSNGNYRSINLGDGVNPEMGLSLRFDFSLSSNSMAALFYNGSGFSAVLIHTFLDITNINKIAFRYATNNFGLFVNGVKVAQSLTGATGGVNLSNLAFNNGVTGANFYGNTKKIQYFNTALSDTELISLTKI